MINDVEVHDPAILAHARAVLDACQSGAQMQQAVLSAVERNAAWRGRQCINLLAPEAPTAVFVNPADLKCIGSAVSDLPLHEDATLASGTSRVEAGRLLVESALDEAFNQLRTAVLETRGKRGRKDSAAEENPTPRVETLDAV